MHAVDVGLMPHWMPGSEDPVFAGDALVRGLARIRETVHIIREGSNGRIGLGFEGRLEPSRPGAHLHLASLPPLYPEWLGDRAFCETHGLRFPYVGGAMANGIASPEMVIALARAGMLGFLGTAGLDLATMEKRLDIVQKALSHEGHSFGANLIHSPAEPELEMRTVELFMGRAVHRVSASAFMGLTPAIVRYAASGLRQDSEGRVVRQNHIFAKISRAEVAARFMAPAPRKILDDLVARSMLSPQEARVAALIPVAEDLTVESDSGGHTDNRPLGALFPVIARLRDELQRKHRYTSSIRLGAAGGLGTPEAVAAAFSLGAAFVLTGSIN
ncbi:MAG: nitronate monooxygenase, partial [Bradymonadaceae bacterium]